MAGLQPITLGGSGGMLPQEILVVLGVPRHILVHAEPCRNTYRTSWEEAHWVAHYHYCLLSYWNW